MATTKSEFVELAAELIGDEFADFRGDATITQSLGFDYSTQSDTEQQQIQQMIPLDYKEDQIDGTLIKTGDIMLIGEFQLFEWKPEPDNTFVNFSDEPYAGGYSIRNADIDPAGATITLHCRPI